MYGMTTDRNFSIYALLNNSWTIISQMDIEEE